MTKHIAFIPARKGSKGFPGKNSKFFKYTGDFLKNNKLFDEVIVSTNDTEVEKKAKKYKFKLHSRPVKVSRSSSSIKSTIQCMVTDMKLEKSDIIWLFYIPVTYKNLNDFKNAKNILRNKNVKSILSFVKPEIHPYNFWRYNRKTKKLSQFIKNNISRRQDLPEALRYYHYICCFSINELTKLNDELINSKTYPIILDDSTAQELIEIDTPKDYIKWKQHHESKKTKYKKI